MIADFEISDITSAIDPPSGGSDSSIFPLLHVFGIYAFVDFILIVDNFHIMILIFLQQLKLCAVKRK